MPISPQSVPLSGVADGTGVEDGRAASRPSGERRSWPLFTATTRAASRASGVRRSVFAALVAGTTAAVARTAASVAIVLRVLRLIEPSYVPEPPGAARRGEASPGRETL